MYNPQGSLACGMALPATGLLWWYKFYRNILDDLNGRSITAILKNPNTGIFPNSQKRHPRPFWRCFSGTKRLAVLPSCFLRVDFQENEEEARYFDIELSVNPLVKTIIAFTHHIWNSHPNVEFYHNINTIFVPF